MRTKKNAEAKRNAVKYICIRHENPKFAPELTSLI